MKQQKYLLSKGKVVLSDYREYANFNLCRSKFSRVIRTAVMAWVILIALYLAVVGFVAQSSVLVLAGGVLLLCLGTFFGLLRKQVKTVCIKKQEYLYATHQVQFGNNGLIYSVLFDPEHNSHKLEDTQDDFFYTDFFRVYETGGFFYLYIDKKSTIIVPKRNMMPADSLELRTLLSQKLEKKFIRCI
ncbi:MAG: YcxB family protein [Clostridia bacterium]|nr:YcxB family protein [Clostridia bacterium]MBQ8911722.1 YcxB family protein [Clostridia bacterium]